ncbi:hypothetical protein [Salipiger marinus]|uniref:Uncharacterized protein n=1 Tax=Salipiger marinus TaxID=555512 RepID=A0A1G8PVY0_9RHOB|nr:hypothetical protein [Salipiger marinus]SDI96593.1 hypothetical protein SAMN04487993_1013150 [Salipiger marinus]
MIQTPRTHTSAQPLLRRVQPATPPTGKKLEEPDFARLWSAMAAAEGHRRVLPPSPPAPPPLDADGLAVGSAGARLLKALRTGPGTRADLLERAGIKRGMWSSALFHLRAAGIAVVTETIRSKTSRTIYRLADDVSATAEQGVTGE